MHAFKVGKVMADLMVIVFEDGGFNPPYQVRTGLVREFSNSSDHRL